VLPPRPSLQQSTTGSNGVQQNRGTGLDVGNEASCQTNDVAPLDSVKFLRLEREMTMLKHDVRQIAADMHATKRDISRILSLLSPGAAPASSWW